MTSADTDGTQAFFIATAYAKMQEFDKALPYYKKAQRLKHNEIGDCIYLRWILFRKSQNGSALYCHASFRYSRRLKIDFKPSVI